MEMFGTRVKRLRLARGLTVEEVAAQMDVSLDAIRRVENNTHLMRTWRLPMLARILGVSTDYMLTGHEGPALLALHRAIHADMPREQLLAMVANYES